MYSIHALLAALLLAAKPSLIILGARVVHPGVNEVILGWFGDRENSPEVCAM